MFVRTICILVTLSAIPARAGEFTPFASFDDTRKAKLITQFNICTTDRPDIETAGQKAFCDGFTSGLHYCGFSPCWAIGDIPDQIYSREDGIPTRVLREYANGAGNVGRAIDPLDIDWGNLDIDWNVLLYEIPGEMIFSLEDLFNNGAILDMPQRFIMIQPE